MTLGKLIDNGLLNRCDQINAADEICMSWTVEDEYLELIFGETEKSMIFSLESEVEIDGDSVVACEKNTNESWWLSFFKLENISPDPFLDK